MKPENGANRLTDTYATRSLTPGSLEVFEAARSTAAEDFSRAKGVGRDDLDRGLLDGGFLDAEGLRAILADLESEGRAVESETLARHLVRTGKLTRYQASALFQGKGRSLQIGPYVVLDKLGSGGMGMVFKAALRKGGPEIALKLLPPSASRHANAVLRFRREAEIMEKLNHPNLVASHEIGQYGGVHYLVMDYVEGRDLDRVVRATGPLKLNRAIDCIIQAARGLGAAHERGIVHRDIKPANLFVTHAGDDEDFLKLLDFGVARMVEAPSEVSSLTESGILFGTPAYMSPEVCSGEPADARSDIYSLGAALYFMVTGTPLFPNRSFGDTVMSHVSKVPERPSVRLGTPVAHDLEAIIMRCLEKWRDARYSSARELDDALAACADAGHWTRDDARAFWQTARSSMQTRARTSAR
jgi:serine/threonine protein kinase